MSVSCGRFLRRFESISLLCQAESSARFSEDGEPLLLREPHKEFLMKAFSGLPGGYVSLDASRTWLVYWTVHSLVLLDEPLPEDVQTRVIGTRFQFN
jgi:prenyltransferase beta subunit